MASYHLNPKSGESGLSSAVTAEVSGLAKAEQLALSSVVDVQLLNRMLKERYIYRSVHPKDDSLVLLCYGTLTQVHGKWNDATKLARGLIIRRGTDDLRDALILERPWSKFFTLQQQENGWHLGDEENESSAEDVFQRLDFEAPASVYDKMDGSLGILYRDPEGLPAFATKGSFGSEQALSYTRDLRKNDETLAGAELLLKENPDTTVLFELVGPKNRVVLSYESTGAVLLGGSQKVSGNSVTPESLNGFTTSGFDSVERMSAKNLTEALALPSRENREGVVVSIEGPNPMKIKIKQDDYLRMHRIVTMFSKKDSRALVMDLDETASYADLLAVANTQDVTHFQPIKDALTVEGFSDGDEIYEMVRKRREDYFKEILLPRALQVKKAKDLIDSLDDSYFQGENPQKRFAALVKELPADSSSLFPLYRARMNGQPTEEMSAFHEIRRAIQDVKDTND